MNPENKDRYLSIFIVFLTIVMIFYILLDSGGILHFEGKTLKDIFLFIINKYFDFTLMAYIFICLQFSGFVELKYKQDFIKISLLSIVFTPFSLLFILQDENKQD